MGVFAQLLPPMCGSCASLEVHGAKISDVRYVVNSDVTS